MNKRSRARQKIPQNHTIKGVNFHFLLITPNTAIIKPTAPTRRSNCYFKYILYFEIIFKMCEKWKEAREEQTKKVMQFESPKLKDL